MPAWLLFVGSIWVVNESLFAAGVGERNVGADCGTPSDRKRAFLSRLKAPYRRGRAVGRGWGVDLGTLRVVLSFNFSFYFFFTSFSFVNNKQNMYSHVK